MYQKHLVTFPLLLSLVLSSFLPPFANRARAQFAVIDPAHIAVTQAEATRKSILDGLDIAARAAAQAIIQRMVDSTVSWASSGFEGNPAYATDPKQYFADIADGVAGEFIGGSDLAFLCSPFQTQIRLALQKSYNGNQQRFQCTLTEVVGNIDAFYGDFSQGGWDGWFAMTQNNQNNPYGTYLDAQVELDSRIASAVGLQREQLSWNQGFLSFASCAKKNPPAMIQRPDGSWQSNPNAVPGKAEGECIEPGPIKTPGSIIKSQLDKVLPANMERFINAQHLEDLVEAFVTGALKKYVFSSQGLF